MHEPDPVQNRRSMVIGLKRPASRDLFDGAVRQTNHMQAIERRLRRTAIIITRSLTASLWSSPGPNSNDGTRTNLLFTISYRTGRGPQSAANFASLRMTCRQQPGNGGAGRDRTDDILLAKQALSQLSYGP